MRKLVAIFIFLMITVTISAQENPEFKNQTIEFLKLTGTGAAFENAIGQIGATVPDLNRVAYTEEANTTLDGLYSKMADLYMKEFTPDEIKELVAFYNTDLGKKVSSKQMALSQQAMMLGQAWGGEIQQIAQKHSK
ncbi:DUF2059 domain-containing protein [Kriegella aquimaris]|uniref:DUF2059 domain-containing protein n=1 Tax=Kriegella aquimaris TaxID=192904 RepID=A0A1G9QJW8_9FLAO|nr:DUF2059 domain-containing protein [Kriegella aquimaris]SDM11151.1 hypothetical protein SAMN04488514_10572 [Kriegella aquimaris]